MRKEAATPKISVVIASVNGWPPICECLLALQRQQGDIAAEVIVADCCADGTSERIRKTFPWVKLLVFSERLGIPELRAVGMAHARGEIITITEDHCIPRDDWYVRILAAHESSYGAVGGPVENGSVTRIIDWAVYFCEYSHSMPPVASGEVDGIPGNNASYKRGVLDKVDESIKKSCWEYFLHEELRRAGVKFLLSPDIMVWHKKQFGFLYFLAQRFHYSRSFAAMRQARVSASRRLFYVLSSPLLPFILLSRMTRQILKKRSHIREFVCSLPLLSIFMISYTCGEVAGYLFGGGKSLVKVE